MMQEFHRNCKKKHLKVEGAVWKEKDTGRVFGTTLHEGIRRAQIT